MNKLQKKIIVIGALIMILMGMIPPWTYTLSSRANFRTKPAGYSLIITPPPPERNAIAFGVELDLKRLLVQWIIVAIAMGVGITLAHKQHVNSMELNNK